MRLSTAAGILSQVFLVSSTVWAQTKLLPNRQYRHSERRDVASTSRRIHPRNKQRIQRKSQQQQQRLLSVLQNRPNLRQQRKLARENETATPTPLRKCDADIGILSCGVGEYCQEGYCVSSQQQQQGVVDATLQRRTEAYANFYCNPESDYFDEDLFGEDGFFDCECNVDLESGLGTALCTYEGYCMYDYCCDIDVTFTFNDPEHVTWEYCYHFTEPYHLYCVTGHSDYSSCTISINEEDCQTCTVAATDDSCENGSDYFFSTFDCTALMHYSGGNAGDGCAEGVYASGFIASWMAGELESVANPTEPPSSSPSGSPTSSPTSSPSSTPSSEPSLEPTKSPVVQMIHTEETFMNQVLNIMGIQDLAGDTLAGWVQGTENYLEAYYNSMQDMMSNVDVNIAVVDIVGANSGAAKNSDNRQRQLPSSADDSDDSGEDAMVTVVFNQVMAFDMQEEMAGNMLEISTELSSMPFAETTNYVSMLQSMEGMESVVAASSATMEEEDESSEEEDTKKAKGKKKKGAKKKGRRNLAEEEAREMLQELGETQPSKHKKIRGGVRGLSSKQQP